MTQFFYNNNLLLLLLVIWSIPWKLYAVWMAAAKRQKGWFVVLIIVNTFSILEIIYIFYIIKKTPVEIRRDISKAFSSWRK